MNKTSTRRNFRTRTLAATAAADLGIWIRPESTLAETAPQNDPTAHLTFGWTRHLKWDNVLDITSIPGREWADRIEKAQQRLRAKGGGVVYFPPGKVVFTDSIFLDNGIILRGSPPTGTSNTKENAYKPLTEYA